jgi:hypothetical protein
VASDDTRNLKILVFPPNFITIDVDVVFILPGTAEAAGGLSLSREVATDLLFLMYWEKQDEHGNQRNFITSVLRLFGARIILVVMAVVVGYHAIYTNSGISSIKSVLATGILPVLSRMPQVFQLTTFFSVNQVKSSLNSLL